MKLDKRFYPHTVAILIFALALLYSGNYLFPAQTALVTIVESIQSLLLLSGALFTWCYVKPLLCDRPRRVFWLWSISWWALLFGRGISWGRDYFPEVPKLYFRLISILLIGIMLAMLLLPVLRQEIARRWRTEPIPLWDSLLLVIYFLIVDTVQHHRRLAFLFVSDALRTDMIEEFIELPFMLSLFFIAYFLQKKDKQAISASVKALTPSSSGR